MEYYGLIILSVVMFGMCFAFNDIYRKNRGSSLMISMESTFIGGLAGLIALLSLNGFKFEFTVFTGIIATFAAVNSVAFTFFTFKALDKVNLSVFSLFSMLGGMALPSVVGIIFYNEGITLAKIVCYVFIVAALMLTVNFGARKGEILLYAGVFVLNGMSGVFSKIFTAAPFEKTSAAGYSVLAAIITVMIAGSSWLILASSRNRERSVKPFTWKILCVGALSGSINKVANFILVIALAHVPASVQYPMVTGGVIIVSTLICFFGARRPSKKEIISVCLAFAGMMALFAIPI